MGVKTCVQTGLAGLRRRANASNRNPAAAAVLLSAAVVSLGLAVAAVHAEVIHHRSDVRLTSGPPPEHFKVTTRLVWEGADLDGDGQPDIANPTGKAPRQADAYGEGRFHATRDGGEREHEGVDYVATAGQTVEAPISGYVARIGYAYPDDQTLRYVEIDNPALHLTARVFYVDPKVEVGDSVAVGRPIGQAHTLQHRYPLGITDHVHLEIADAKGRRLDAGTLIVARNIDDRMAAD
ncbi:M23 family metallopeptidase [Phenylobacterium sp.]|uniref:M23 family metallopeptidase n=1 Tax=Phenylobacterium sp. TaxID=1871053 RepID=UPI00356AFA6B